MLRVDCGTFEVVTVGVVECKLFGIMFRTSEFVCGRGGICTSSECISVVVGSSG